MYVSWPFTLKHTHRDREWKIDAKLGQESSKLTFISQDLLGKPFSIPALLLL